MSFHERRCDIFGKNIPIASRRLPVGFKLSDDRSFANFDELRKTFPNADKVEHWIVFNIAGNKYRLIASVHFNRGKLYIRHVLTHAVYDRGIWKR